MPLRPAFVFGPQPLEVQVRFLVSFNVVERLSSMLMPVSFSVFRRRTGKFVYADVVSGVAAEAACNAINARTRP